MPRSNEQWLRAMRGGDSEAAAALRTYLHKTLARGFGRQLSNAELEDAAQATMVRILEKLDSYRGDSAFPTWAASIGVNLALSQLRARKYAAMNLEDAIQSGRVALTRDSTLHRSIQRREASEVLYAAIEAALTPSQREALLAELGGLPATEVARQTGRSRGALYKLLHDARKKLRAALEEQGLTTADLVSATSQGEVI